MFDYPLPSLYLGLYAELGLGPEATAEEINDAKQELATRIRQQQKHLQRQIDDVYQKLPELRETRAKLKTLQQSSAGASTDENWKLNARLAALNDSASEYCNDFRTLCEQQDELEKKLNKVNLIAIQNPEDRLEYDRAHPPFELIKLAECGASPLDERKNALLMLRAELSDFLEQAGETVFHPSDLTREDFLHDYTQDVNLDRKR